MIKPQQEPEHFKVEVGDTSQRPIDSLNIIVVGESGVGKTRLASTTPDPTRTLVIDSEHGLLSLKKYPVKFVSIADQEDKIAALSRTYLHIKQNINDYDWVIIDSFTEILDSYLDYQEALEVELAIEQKRNVNGYAHYNAVVAKAKEVIAKFKMLKVHVVFVCLQSKVIVGDYIVKGPMLPGRTLPSKIGALFDIVLNMQVGEVSGEKRRLFQTCINTDALAKDRSGDLKPWEPAHLGHILAKIQAGGES